MRRILALLTAVVLVSCGGSDDESSDTTDAADATEETADDAASDDNASDDTEADAPEGDDSGDVDCAEIEAALEQVGIPLQLMAQIRDPAVLQSIEDGVMAPLDIDAFLAAVAQLRVLEAFASPLGDPGESLDTYEDAGLALKALLVKDTVTQAEIDEYNTHVGEVGDFLGKQVAIAGALDETGC